MPTILAPTERFWPKVDKDGPVPEHRPELGPCWVWRGATSGGGYGWFMLSRAPKKSRQAHVFAWTEANGPVPAGKELDHLCRNRLCVRPGHLEPVTRAENIRRGVRPDQMRETHAARTHCKRGHAFDAANTYVDKRGARVCKACRRVAVNRSQRERRRRARDARAGSTC